MREWEKIIDDETNVIFKLDRPKWSIAYLFFMGGWECIARIDNYPHQGRQEPHIHKYKQERVEFKDMSFDDATDVIMDIGGSIKERIKHDIY